MNKSRILNHTKLISTWILFMVSRRKNVRYPIFLQSVEMNSHDSCYRPLIRHPLVFPRRRFLGDVEWQGDETEMTSYPVKRENCYNTFLPSVIRSFWIYANTSWYICYGCLAGLKLRYVLYIPKFCLFDIFWTLVRDRCIRWLDETSISIFMVITDSSAKLDL